MQFTVLVLICALSVPAGECDEHTAVDVIATGVPSELGCAQNWQTMIAGSSLREGIGETLYVKTLCRRKHGQPDLRQANLAR